MAIQISGKVKDIDGFSVSRVLPNEQTHMVGPFVFFDHVGPADLGPGEGIDVRPHPHIGLSTVTYMFEGGLLHRDSLGNTIEIVPGDVNWMTAGKLGWRCRKIRPKSSQAFRILKKARYRIL